jgi:hypothetical protein
MQMISPEMWVKSKNRKILRVNLMLRFDVCEQDERRDLLLSHNPLVVRRYDLFLASP